MYLIAFFVRLEMIVGRFNVDWTPLWWINCVLAPPWIWYSSCGLFLIIKYLFWINIWKDIVNKIGGGSKSWHQPFGPAVFLWSPSRIWSPFRVPRALDGPDLRWSLSGGARARMPCTTIKTWDNSLIVGDTVTAALMTQTHRTSGGGGGVARGRWLDAETFMRASTWSECDKQMPSPNSRFISITMMTSALTVMIQIL